MFYGHRRDRDDVPASIIFDNLIIGIYNNNNNVYEYTKRVQKVLRQINQIILSVITNVLKLK